MQHLSRPRLFIGSSSEGLRVARAVGQQLQDQLEVTIWSSGLFGLGGGTLETILDEAPSFDFACLVLTPDDVTASRGTRRQSPRDNVIFECGVFMGVLGRKRTFIVFDSDKSVKLPSDLAGISLAPYRGSRSDGSIIAAVDEACHPIRASVERWGRFGKRQRASSKTQTLVPQLRDWKTVWIIGSTTELSEEAVHFVEKLAGELGSHLIASRARLVVGDSSILRQFAVAYRAGMPTSGEFVPNPVVVEGNLRKVPADVLFSGVIGSVPDLAIVIGGNTSRGRVREEYQNSVASGIPVISLGMLGGAAAGLPPTLAKNGGLDRFSNLPIEALDVGDVAAAIAKALG